MNISCTTSAAVCWSGCCSSAATSASSRSARPTTWAATPTPVTGLRERRTVDARLLLDLEAGVQRGFRIAADPNVEIGGFFHPIFLGSAPVPQLRRPERHVKCFLCVRCQGDALKTLQLTHRTRRAAIPLMHVKLCDLIRLQCSGVFHVEGNVDTLAGLDLRLADLEIGERERGIAQAVTERIERRALLIPVALALLFRGLRGVVRVVDGDLPHIARPGDGQLAAGHRIAKEQIRNGVAALRSRIPRLEKRG